MSVDIPNYTHVGILSSDKLFAYLSSALLHMHQKEHTNDEFPLMRNKIVKDWSYHCISAFPMKECPRSHYPDKSAIVKVPFVCFEHYSSYVNRAKANELLYLFEFRAHFYRHMEYIYSCSPYDPFFDNDFE